MWGGGGGGGESCGRGKWSGGGSLKDGRNEMMVWTRW